MMKLKLNLTDSWHSRLARQAGWDPYWHGYNFCPYARKFATAALFALIMGAVVTTLGFFVVYTVGSFFWWVLLSLFHWNFVPWWEEAKVGVIVFGMGSAFAVIICFLKGVFHFRWLPRLNLPPCEKIPLCEDTKRFFVAFYEMAHDRMCFDMEDTKKSK